MEGGSVGATEQTHLQVLFVSACLSEWPQFSVSAVLITTHS